MKNPISPQLLEQWDYTKNTLDPATISAGSGTSVHWLCKKNHSWKARVYGRSQGSGCPFCSNQRILAGYNDLATTNPELALEWDYEKNTLKPEEIGAGSVSSVHWLCEKNHSWKTRVERRSRGYGCPFCSNKRILAGYNDLVTTNPELALEWDYKKNTLKPEEISAGSKNSVHWLCEKNHSWKARASDRSQGKGCPFCSNKRILAGYNDLVTTNPELALEWDYEKNTLKPEEISAGSGTSVHWLCEKNHSWKAVVKSRTQGNGCPLCRVNKTEEAFRNQFIGFIHGMPSHSSLSKVFLPALDRKIQVDILGTYKGFKIAVEYDGQYWHSSEEIVHLDTVKTQGLLDLGYIVVRIREKSGGKRLKRLNIQHDNLLQVSYEYGEKHETIEELSDSLKEWVKGRAEVSTKLPSWMKRRV